MNIYISTNRYRLLDFAAAKGLHDSNCTFYKCAVTASFKSRLLSTTLVKGSDTAHKLASGMQKVFQARGISEKVKIITSDNSPNVKAGVLLSV